MKHVLPLLTFLLTCVNLFGQTSYSGFIGEWVTTSNPYDAKNVSLATDDEIKEQRHTV